MKLARLIDPKFHSALDKLAAESLPLKTAFKLKGLVKTIREEFTKYEDVRKSALQKFGKKDDNGQVMLDENGNVVFEGNSFTEFAAELGSLANEEISLPTLKISELGDKLTLTLEEIESLDGLIVED